MKTELEELQERVVFWEKRAKIEEKKASYYQEQLEKSHAILGRVIHQLSERWDSVTITKYLFKGEL